jgi:hypothetical protein
MSAEENMALARRFLEAQVLKGDLDAMDEMMTPGFVRHTLVRSRAEKPALQDRCTIFDVQDHGGQETKEGTERGLGDLGQVRIAFP